MKIVAVTEHGYMAELTAREIAQISGKDALGVHPSSYYRKGTIPMGTTVSVQAMFEHVQQVTKHEAMRKSIAEQLRAAATVVETTMDVVSIPKERKDSKEAQEQVEG